jgi:hypothetical protein
MGKTFQQYIDYDDVVKSHPAQCLRDNHDITNGKLVLTEKKLLFGCSLKDKPHFAIDLDTINSIARESYLVDHNILAINFLQYEVARFSVNDYAGWEKAIEEQRMMPHINNHE